MVKVSVITATYNRARLLERAIDSVLACGRKDVEILVCDDGSTDETPALIAGYQQRFSDSVRHLQMDHSGLPAVARNHGLQAARGQYVAFLDSDDRWLPAKLHQQLSVLENEPSIGLVCSNAYRVLGDGEAERGLMFVDRPADPSSPVLHELLANNFVINSSAVIRRSLMNVAGGFCEDPQLRALEDWDLWLRVAAISEVRYLHAPLLVYRDAPETSIRGQRSRTDHWKGVALIAQRLRRFARDSEVWTPELERVVDRMSLECDERLVRALLVESRLGKAGACLLRLMGVN